LKTRILGQAALYFRELTSTNDFAKELATRGAREGTIVLAETQIRGRGRIGREWTSPQGGLWFSIILRPSVLARQATRLTLLASVAVAKTISKLYDLKTEIKWPNDVLIDEKKVCGILTEGEIKGTLLKYVLLGVGVNANFNIDALPVHLRDSATTLKQQLGKDVELETLLCRLLEEAESYYEMLRNHRYELVLNDWRRLTNFLGSHVRVESNGEKIEGVAVDIDSDGALIVRMKDQTLRRVVSGDVTMTIQREHPNYVDE